MKNILLVFSFLTLIQLGFSQTRDTIIVNGDTVVVLRDALTPADSLRQIGDLKGAIESFKNAYEIEGTNFNELYNYACALSLDDQIDSAFKYLLIAATKDTSPFMLCDPDLLNLRKDNRWGDFETNLIAAIQKKYNHRYKDIEYAKKLWYMHVTDQAYYDCIFLAEDKIGKGSIVVKALWKIKESLNLENQKELERLIDKKGWPKNSQVGKEAAQSAFLVIQHSDAEKQKKYLPTIEKLCKDKEADWESYALMYDRVQISDNKPQKFGSQIRFNPQTSKYELFPLLDESKVEQWRQEVGLGSLAKYVAQWDIKFEPNKK